MKLSEDYVSTLQEMTARHVAIYVAAVNAVYGEAHKALGMRDSARRAATPRATGVQYVVLRTWAASGQRPDAFALAAAKKALAAVVMEQARHGAASSNYRKELHLLTGIGLLTPVLMGHDGDAYRVDAVRVLEASATRLREMIAGKVEDAIADGMLKDEAKRHSEGLGGHVMALEYERLVEKIRR